MISVRPEIVDHRSDPGKIGVTGVGRRRVDTNEEQPRTFQEFVHVGGEAEPVAVLCQQFRKAGFVNCDFAPTERIHFFLHHVAGNYRMSEFGKAGSRNQANPADSDDADGRLFF